MKRLAWLIVAFPSLAFAGNPECPIHHVEGLWTGQTKLDQWQGNVFEYSHVIKGPHAYWSSAAPGSTANSGGASSYQPSRPVFYQPTYTQRDVENTGSGTSELVDSLIEIRQRREANDREERRLRMEEEEHQMRLQEGQARLRLLDEQRELLTQQGEAPRGAEPSAPAPLPYSSVRGMVVALSAGLNGSERPEDTTDFALAVGYIAGVHQLLSVIQPCVVGVGDLPQGQVGQLWVDHAIQAPTEWRNPSAVAAITARVLLDASQCPADSETNN